VPGRRHGTWLPIEISVQWPLNPSPRSSLLIGLGLPVD